VHLGATAHRYFGEIDSRRREMPVDAANVEERLVRDLSGWGATFGVEVQAGSRLAFGASLETPVTLDGDHTGSSDVVGTILPENGDYEVQYPLTWALGATFHPRNELRTTFSAEARFRNWDGLEDGYADALVDAVLLDDPDAIVQTLPLRDTWDIRVGVEHVFYNGMPIRFGLRYLENATDRDSERTIFSAGTGWQAGEVTIDFTFQYHRQTSRQEFVFDEGAAGISNPTLTPKVEDSVLRGILGVRRSF
jgi:long-subunit fatty acid transport protein